jgi:glutamate racemase
VQCAGAVAQHGVKLLVVACNTASAVALPALERAMAPVPVIGVIEPGAEAAVAASPKGRVAVIATEGTVKGGAYIRAIHARNPAALVTQAPCPLFVALAEEGLTEGPIPELVAKRYLGPLLKAAARPECLVLGCTHFPALAGVIARIAGNDVTLVDSARTTAQAVERLLASRDLVNPHAASPPRFLATDSPERFARVGEIFLGAKLGPVEFVDLQRSQ